MSSGDDTHHMNRRYINQSSDQSIDQVISGKSAHI